jgi:prepilin-type processing-associated H-X9-DG protein
VAIGEIQDGTSNTFLAGEKYMSPDYYETPDNAAGAYVGSGDGYSVYGGDCGTITRWVPGPTSGGWNPINGGTSTNNPLRDTPGYNNNHPFGSPHAGGFNMVFCDGSVRQISYGVNLIVYGYMGNRHDGQAIDPTAYNM